MSLRTASLCSGSEAGSYFRLVDSFLTQLEAQGPSRTCDESKEEEEPPATWCELYPGSRKGRFPLNGDPHRVTVQGKSIEG